MEKFGNKIGSKLILAALAALVLLASLLSAAFTTSVCLAYEGGDIDPGFSRGEASHPSRPPVETVVQTAYKRVLNPYTASKVELVAFYENKSLFANNVYIRISDPDSGDVAAVITPYQNSGYMPSMFFADFTGSECDQIFFSMDSGGSGGYSYNYIYDVRGGENKIIFDGSQLPSYSAEYKDGYKVEIKNYSNEKSYIADISSRGKDYLDGIYGENGELRERQYANVWYVSTVFPYYNPTMRKYQLMSFQRVTGLYNADVIGNMVNLLDYRDGNFYSYFEGLMLNN